MRKALTSILLAALVLLGCGGCTARQSSSAGCLELVDSPSTTLDNVWYNTGGIFRCAVFDSLVTTQADMQTITPALAKSYTCSEDGLTYQFQLREGVTWHDGLPLTGEDVLWSVKTMLRSSEVNGLLASTFRYIEGAEAYQSGQSQDLPGLTVEGNTITFRLTSPAGSFLSAVAQFAILPQHLLGDDPDMLAQDAYWLKPVGCGPYRITEAAAGDYFLLERNPDYYGPRPGIENIRLRVNMDDCVSAMQAGDLDFYVTNDPAEIAKLKGMEDCSEHQLNILFPAYLIFNLSADQGVNQGLKDVRVRQALMLALDRESVVDTIFPGSTVSDTMVPAWDSWYLSDGEEYRFDPAAARQLLEEAGYDFSQPIRLRYFTKGQSTADLMNAIAVYWRDIGLTVELDMFEGSGSEHMFELRDYDVCYKRLSAFNHAAIYEEMAGEGVMQTSIYHLPVYDDLISRLSMTLDEGSRRDIVGQMQALDQEYLLRLPLFALANVAYVNDARFAMPEAYGNLWYRYDLSFEEWSLVD